MDSIIYKNTGTKPAIILDRYKEIFEIKGKSMPEDAVEFYGPIIAWFKEYFQKPNPVTVLNLELEYINSASSKKLFDVISLFEEPASKGVNVKVNWRYHEDDDDSLDTGNELASLLNVPFIFSTL